MTCSPTPRDALAALTPRLAGRRVLVAAGAKLDRRGVVDALTTLLVEQSAGPIGRLGCDLGSPSLGPPGAVALHRCEADALSPAWQLQRLEALATLDSARYRLPLVAAAARLAAAVTAGETLLVEAPCVLRGAARDELIAGLAAALAIEQLLLLWGPDEDRQPATALAALGHRVLLLEADASADRQPSKGQRRRERSAAWDRYLEGGSVVELPLAPLTLLGRRPETDDWAGRQLGLLDQGGQTLALSEALETRGEALALRLPATIAPDIALERTASLLVRDARRDEPGLLSSYRGAALPPAPTQRAAYALRPRAAEVVDLGPPTTTRSAGLQVTLVSGIFDDPLVHLRRPKDKRSLLCDLGETQRLPARLAHQVTDVLISHAHVDHVAGFLWFTRSRIGFPAPCRVYGPPGIAAQLAHMLGGITWNLVADSGPCFEVTELCGDQLRRARVRAGDNEARLLDTRPAEAGLPRTGRSSGSVLHEDETLRIRAVVLDHLTPVLAYAVEDRRSGDKLIYATDFGDTEENREALLGLAAGAHTLICEASFREQDRALAEACRHLTTRGCGELATLAGVEQLVPFHFSRRYEREPQALYAELLAACPQTVVPPRVRELLAATPPTAWPPVGAMPH
jgi:ribonuclease Z